MTNFAGRSRSSSTADAVAVAVAVVAVVVAFIVIPAAAAALYLFALLIPPDIHMMGNCRCISSLHLPSITSIRIQYQ